MNSVPATPGSRRIENVNGSESDDVVGSTHIKRHSHELNKERRLAPSARRANSALPKDENFTAIDKIDINKIFDSEKGIVKVNHSPIKIDLSPRGIAEESSDGVIPDPKRLKLELALAPNLSQPDTGIGTIEMLASSTKNSPRKEDGEDAIGLEEVIKESKKSHDSVVATPNSADDKVNSILELQRLTPVEREDGQGEKNDTPGKELFQLVSKRNEELVTQIHHLNRSINEVINSCDSSVGKYRRQFDDLKQGYMSELDVKKRELASATEDCNALKERLDVAKRRISETRDEIKMLNQNQSILKNKYEEATAELEDCKKKSNELEEENSKLKSKFSENSMNFSKLEEVYQETLRRVENLLDERCESDRKVNELDRELEARTQEKQKLEIQLEESSAANQGNKDEKTRQIEELTIRKDGLESEISNLQLKLHSLETELQSIKGTVVTYETDEVRLRDDLEIRKKDCQHWQKEYETVNDDVEILKAEVKELYSDLDEQKELKAHLENSVAQLEQEVNDWHRKDEDHRKDYDKIVLELDSIHLKYNNTEREHLTELEQLHDNLSSLQITLKKDSELISELTRKNDSLESQLKCHSPDQNQNLQHLREEIDSWKEKYRSKEVEFNRSLKLLAEDLYIQYSSKHEQKVKLLKKGYESKYENKLEKLSLQNEGLEQEVTQLKSQVLTERKEKQKLIGLLENRTNENEPT